MRVVACGLIVLQVTGPLVYLCWRHEVPWLAMGVIMGAIVGVLSSLDQPEELPPAQRRAMREDCRRKGIGLAWGSHMRNKSIWKRY